MQLRQVYAKISARMSHTVLRAETLSALYVSLSLRDKTRQDLYRKHDQHLEQGLRLAFDAGYQNTLLFFARGVPRRR